MHCQRIFKLKGQLTDLVRHPYFNHNLKVKLSLPPVDCFKHKLTQGRTLSMYILIDSITESHFKISISRTFMEK